MINRAGMLTAIALVSAQMAPAFAGQAVAGSVVEEATRAETLLREDKPLDALGAADDAYQAVWQAIPLTFTKATFVAGPPEGYGRFTPREGNAFAAGEEIVVYAEPVGYGYGKSDQGYAIDLDADLEVRTPSGQVLAGQEGFSRLSHLAPIRERAFNVTLTFAFDGLKPGDYVLAVTLRDAHSDKSGAFELPFSISAPQAAPADDGSTKNGD